MSVNHQCIYGYLIFHLKKYFMNHFLISDPQKLSNTNLLWDLTIAVLITSSFGAVLFLLCLFKYYLSNCLIERRDQDSPYSLLKQNNRAKPQSYGSSWHKVLYKDSIIKRNISSLFFMYFISLIINFIELLRLLLILLLRHKCRKSN